MGIILKGDVQIRTYPDRQNRKGKKTKQMMQPNNPTANSQQFFVSLPRFALMMLNCLPPFVCLFCRPFLISSQAASEQ